MTMIRSSKPQYEENSFVPIDILPADTYPGRLIRIVDLGTHRDTDINGQPAFVNTKIKNDAGQLVDTQKLDRNGNPIPKMSRKLLLTIEIPGELISQPGGKQDGKPYTVIKEVTESFDERANWKGIIASLKGIPKDAEILDLDYTTLLGSAVSVQYGRASSGKGKVISISKPAKGTVVEPVSGVNNMYVFSLDPAEFQKDIFDSLPKFYRERIEGTKEFKNLVMEQHQQIHTQGQNVSPFPVEEVATPQTDNLPWE